MRFGHPVSRSGLATVRGWNLVGAEEDLFYPTPPHISGMPLWYRDREHYTKDLLPVHVIYDEGEIVRHN